MVAHLAPPERPLSGGLWWRWDGRQPWFRVYHATPDRLPTTRRRHGPIQRFDPHTPPWTAPAECPAGRSVIYLGDSVRTAAAEVFGAHRLAAVCPRYRIAALVPRDELVVQNLRGAGAMMIGGLPAMSVGDIPRRETQAWARAIHEDRPANPSVCGVRYTSAYAAGISLALWDTAPDIAVARIRGRAQDFALADPQLYGRLLAALAPLRIEVRAISSADCARCRR
ncbi:MAG: RES family NAD+ phosphorylase [Chloroflexi bacterium]|nr:RES family NAD+ phosphorylase [Chloroflexota bacterium]